MSELQAYLHERIWQRIYYVYETFFLHNSTSCNILFFLLYRIFQMITFFYSLKRDTLYCYPFVVTFNAGKRQWNEFVPLFTYVTASVNRFTNSFTSDRQESPDDGNSIKILENTFTVSNISHFPLFSNMFLLGSVTAI